MNRGFLFLPSPIVQLSQLLVASSNRSNQSRHEVSIFAPMHSHDTIVALASGQGLAAIALIRLSGEDAITITNKVFKGKNLLEQASHTLHFGTIRDGSRIIDEVLVAVFKAPHSFTTENAVEISCHGSPIIVREVIKVLLKNGARLAEPGEFTKRAFLNGKMDLVQAEAVGDLIHAETDTSATIRHVDALTSLHHSRVSVWLKSLPASLRN